MPITEDDRLFAARTALGVAGPASGKTEKDEKRDKAAIEAAKPARGLPGTFTDYGPWGYDKIQGAWVRRTPGPGSVYQVWPGEPGTSPLNPVLEKRQGIVNKVTGY